MDYRAPIEDMLFTLNEIVGLPELIDTGAYPDLSEDLVVAILEEAGKLSSEVLSPIYAKGDQVGARLENGVVQEADGFKAAYDKFVETGFGGLPFDPEYGGQGLPFTLAVALMEMWQGANMAFGLCPMLTEGSVKALTHHGTDEQKALYLPKLISGEWTGTMNLTEPQAGSDVGALRARAEPQSDGSYRIRGTKIFITWGDHEMTDNIVHLVLARLPDAPQGTRGISLFLVPKYLVNEDGSLGMRNDVQCLKLEEKLGIHASPTCVLEFGENEGAIGYLIGEENKGMSCMFTMMNSARLNVGTQGVGIAELAYQRAAGYARDRVQGKAVGQTTKGPSAIIEHADIRRTLLHMKSHVEAARAICMANSVAFDLSTSARDSEDREKAKARAELLTPISKAWSTDMGVEIASLGVQVHGGMGYVEETGAAQIYRDSRIAPIYEGTNGIQAIDLSTRKLTMNGARATLDFVDEIKAFAKDLKGEANQRLSEIGTALSGASKSLEETIEWLLQKSKDQPQDVLAGATPYLRLFGNIAGGYYLARGAKAASEGLAEDGANQDFLKSRIVTAAFFAKNVLPLSSGLSEGITSGSEVLFELSSAQLAG